MNNTFGSPVVPPGSGDSRVLSILLWLTVSVGWLVSTFSVIQEMCMVSACRDTAAFTVFGFNMGWFGIAYFSLLLIVLWLRKKDCRLEWLFSALVFSGVGAELRLLWIQKYVIGGWCPLCVTICCALFITATLLVVEKLRCMVAGQCAVNGIFGWLAFLAAAVATGLSVAVAGVKALL